MHAKGSMSMTLYFFFFFTVLNFYVVTTLECNGHHFAGLRTRKGNNSNKKYKILESVKLGKCKRSINDGKL